MKTLLIAALFLAPVSSFAQFQDPFAVMAVTQEALATASRLEEAAGKKDNAAIFAKMLKRSKKVSLYWGHDVLNKCKRSETQGVTYAYTAFDPVQKKYRFLNICPFAVEQATGPQMVFVFLHELAHQWGVHNEAEANFVAHRVFALMGWGNPFLYKELRDFLNHMGGIDAESKRKVSEILTADPTLERYSAQLKKETRLWSESDQAWDGSPYKELGARNSATSVHRFLVFGGFVFSKTRHLTR